METNFLLPKNITFHFQRLPILYKAYVGGNRTFYLRRSSGILSRLQRGASFALRYVLELSLSMCMYCSAKKRDMRATLYLH